MRRWLLLCVVLGGCGFHSPAPARDTSDGGSGGGIDGTAPDGTGSGSGSDASGVTDCFQHWLNGSVAISASTIQEVTELSSAGNGNDRDPWISSDGLRMYLSRDQGTSNTSDIFFTSRATASQPFGAPMRDPNLSTSGQDGRVWLTPDELTVVQSTDSSGTLEIHMITRASGNPFGTPDGRHLNAVNLAGNQRFDPFVTADGLRLYLSANSGAGGKRQLLIATRSSVDGDFAAPALVPGTDSYAAASANLTNLADPTLYEGERLMLFSAFPNGAMAKGDLWYATRSSASASFDPPIQIPTVNTGGDEFDPVLSADGCELYFSSTRNGGTFHIFHAQVTR